MDRIVLALAFAASASLAAPALAQDDKNAPVLLEPSTHWNVDFGQEKCRLARAFGDVDSRHLLFIEQGGPKSGFGLIVVGPAFKKFRQPDRITVQFGEFAPVGKYRPMLGDTEGVGTSLIYSNMVFFEKPRSEREPASDAGLDPLPRLDVEAASSINAITMHQGKRSVVFNTGNLGEAIKVLNECSLNFVESWGLDRAAHETMTRLAKWANAEAVTRRIQDKYPMQALRKGESGIFRMRVIVEPDGSVSECEISNATITESLDSPACKEMERAEFEPALDVHGKPMRSFYLTNITYKIS